MGWYNLPIFPTKGLMEVYHHRNYSIELQETHRGKTFLKSIKTNLKWKKNSVDFKFLIFFIIWTWKKVDEQMKCSLPTVSFKIPFRYIAKIVESTIPGRQFLTDLLK